MSDVPENKKGGRFSSLIRITLALVILAWIALTLPWDDNLTFHGPAGSSTAVGEIDGDWKGDEIRFRVSDDALSAAWPEEARQATLAGHAFSVRRRESGKLGFDWQPSMTRAFRDMDGGQLGAAMGLFVLATFFSSTRWWRLLALAGCPTSWFNAFRLTYIGFCFNLVMPGLTGGDLVKGAIAAKENPKRRADAVVSVLVDRVIGLAALAVLAAVVILVSEGDAFAPIKLPLIGLIVAGLLGAAFYANKPLRRKVGLSALVDKLPLGDKLRQLDEAALMYLRHPAEVALATALSFANHLIVCVGVFFLGRAIGVGPEQASLGDFLVVAPVANIVSAIPLAPGGWGVGEFVYKELFALVGVSEALGVAVSVTFRLCMLLGLGMIGSLFLLLPGVRAEAREAQGTTA